MSNDEMKTSKRKHLKQETKNTHHPHAVKSKHETNDEHHPKTKKILQSLTDIKYAHLFKLIQD